MKSRVGYAVVIPQQQLERIKLNQCPSCGKHKDRWARRKDWRCCSEECTRDWWRVYVSYGWSELRMKALIRDKFKCVKCKFKGKTDTLIGDHILAIALGGEEFDLKNVQTLCKPCNKIKTSRDLKDIANLRRVEKLQKNQGVSHAA